MAIGIGLGAPWYLVVLAGVSLLGFWTLVWFKMK
jgi:hypothetical protein